jgi:cyclophilin family peptidyl-prolyl cis-trans isomerase
VVGDGVPIYEETMEDLGRSNETPMLPFNAYGTLAMARAEFENNSASSQVPGTF